MTDMWEVWIHFGINEWKMIGKVDSFIEAEDIMLDAYVHRADDFISVAVYDQFDNRHMYIDEYGQIEQVCRIKWCGDKRDNTFKD